MLRQLNIKDFILMEEAQLSFGSGFHVFSGETGSGKSAVLHALRLVGGERADVSIVRHGAAKGSVEAVFDLSKAAEAIELLQDSGIDLDDSFELVIRREVHVNGKSKAWINHQIAHLSLLKRVSSFLMQIVEQNASRRLQSTQDHLHIVDTHGDLTTLAESYTKGWEQLQATQKQLVALKENEGERLRLIEVCKMELAEIEEAAITAEEEDIIFAEYSLLANAAQRSALCSDLLNNLQEGGPAIIPRLHRMAHKLEELQTLDPSIKARMSSLSPALLELQELSYELQRYSSQIDSDAKKLASLDGRLALISKLKKKYGGSCAAIVSYGIKAKKRVVELEQSDNAIELLEKEVETQKKNVFDKAAYLTAERSAAALSFAGSMEKELHELNMPQAQFFAAIIPNSCNRHGNESIEFFLQSNVGEKKTSLCTGASGGEIARVLLALHVLLAGKDKTPTLFFDEIDANIGGLTATKIAKKLIKIAKNHQVICVTHFRQVAEPAEHHLTVVKKEIEGRTVSVIEMLSVEKRDKELIRMSGISSE